MVFSISSLNPSIPPDDLLLPDATGGNLGAGRHCLQARSTPGLHLIESIRVENHFIGRVHLEKN